MATTLSRRVHLARLSHGHRSQRGFWNIAIPAIIGAVGSIAGGALSSSGQKDANKSNVKIAREQMDFQRDMSNTAYQRGVKDMQAAGLNPMLAYSQGGASTPAGQTAVMQNEKAAIGGGIASSAQQAVGIMQQMQQMEQVQATVQNTKANTAQTIAETLSPELYTGLAEAEKGLRMEKGHLAYAGTRKSYQEIENLVAEIAGIRARSTRDSETTSAMQAANTFHDDTRRRKADATMAEYDLSEHKATSEFYKQTGTSSQWVRMLMQVLGPILRAGGR